MTFYVYGLEDPRTNALRYVGYTGDVRYRLFQHTKPSKNRGHCHRANWLRELRGLGLCPDLLLIATRKTRAEAQQAERDAITRFRSEGCDLVNGTPGGDGGPTMLGRKLTPEQCAKIGAAHRGLKRSPETCKRISIASLGRGKGVPLSEEHRKKIGLAQRDRVIPEDQRLRISIKNKGRLAGMRWRVEGGRRVWYGTPTQTRTCACGSSGPFHKSKATRDGLTNRCVECAKAPYRREPQRCRRCKAPLEGVFRGGRNCDVCRAGAKERHREQALAAYHTRAKRSQAA